MTENIIKKDKVAIVGFAPDSRADVARIFDDPTFAVYGLNELYMESDMQQIMLSARADAWFQLHGYEPPTVRDAEQTKHLAMLKCPVYMWAKHRDIPNSIVYPLDEIVRHFDIFGEGMAPEVVDPRDRAYFTNTISWMLALAVYQGFKEIHVFGVNMAQSQEFAHQRPSCEFFLGWARGAGIKIYLPLVSDLLLSPYLYGLDHGKRIFVKYEKRVAELEGRTNQVRNERINYQNAAQQALNAENQLVGAKEDVEYCYHLGVGSMRGAEEKEQVNLESLVGKIRQEVEGEVAKRLSGALNKDGA